MVNDASLFPIDFVIPWVDGSDPCWQAERSKYDKNYEGDGNTEVRFRDWENLQYWFRCVEENAPWVNKIYFITWGHVPAWLNLQHPKLQIVRHDDYIPKEFLPTFNSHTIELNLHRIPGLSEHFVYFNDDIFLTAPVKREDFFRQGLPCDNFAMNCIYFGPDSVGHIHACDIEIINKHIKKNEVLKKAWTKWFHPQNGKHSLIHSLLLLPWPWFPGFYYQHLANSYLKSTFETVWALEAEILSETCKCRFREKINVNQWIFKFWQLANGQFAPRNRGIGRCFHVKDGNYKGICKCIRKSKHRMLCINDTANTENFLEKKMAVLSAFEDRYPQKSTYEL